MTGSVPGSVPALRSPRRLAMAALACAAAGAAAAAAAAAPRPPIIDMHLHALHADDQGPPPVSVCAPYDRMPVRDARMGPQESFAAIFKTAPPCAHPVVSAPTDDALRERSLAELRRLNITAVTSGSAELVERWRREEPKRIIPALAFNLGDAPTAARLRELHGQGRLAVIGEIGAQYEGVAPDDPRLEPFWALAEELDVPIALHVGPGPPGAAVIGIPAYRMALSDPLLLEPVLVKHPHLRLYVMHAGWPNADHMVGLLYAHPQVYVDTGVIDWSQPRAEFHRYLRRLVEAGYGRRIMFGSDQMVWPDTIGPAVAAIASAAFLTPAQKRDILHDNAARFLRLPDAPP